VRADPLLQLNGISLNPPEDGGVIYLDAAIQQHGLEITAADGKHQIPSNRPQDHLGGQLPGLEGLTLSQLSRFSPSRQAWLVAGPAPLEKLQQNL
jgi:hypothetical protein